MSADSNRDDPSSEIALLRLLVQFRREEYKELSELWRNVDTKAQGTIALAGILLAAFVAFITKAQAPVCLYERILSLVAVVLFTASMIASVLALRLRKSAGSPYLGGGIESAVLDLLQVEVQDRTDRMPDLIREELSLWEECNATESSAIDTKAALLTWGQVFIGFSIACLAAIAILRVLE